MAELPPGPSSLLPPPAPPAPAAAEPRCLFPAGAAPACCSEDEEDDEEHEGSSGGRSPAGGEAAAVAAKGHPCRRCPQSPQEQQQLNGLISPELRHLRSAASLKSKVLSAAEASTTTVTPDGGPRATATKGAGLHSGDSPPNSLPNNARTALPSSAEAATASGPAVARNGLAEGAEPEEEEEDEQVQLLSSSLTAGCSLRSPSGREAEPGEDRTIRYVRYESELQMPDIMRLITKDLSEPYSIYTYRYFIHNWPQLCFLAMVGEECVGAIVCKLDMHKKMFRRGYIAMLAVDSKYRRNGIGTNLVKKAIYAMVEGDCDEVVLETEITNKSALKLYENLGFVRDKRLFRYYLNGVDALRLKLWLR
ncbi:PREDICTED: N-alpha-acetyltransferase 30 [Chrysochloris asiatica]|uniref:N-alpha-acetyltransferase 30 n=1 Tax=Chrysochloris asiatica TaxID=185453 RepID=A0A9B0TPQ6_CHRAS|nr:PREDICTED: N-alpha-acetyltransferase 30 [Chrysochloris asiatica]